MTDPNALSHWFPLIAAAGLPVPQTMIVAMPPKAMPGVWAAFDGMPPAQDEAAALDGFVAELSRAGDQIGWPIFLRTDHTSGKHRWKDTCHVMEAAALPSHVVALAEFSEMADFMGLPWNRWAVRELLPTRMLGRCARYSEMPVCREFRAFVMDGEVRCLHPYWPADALAQGGAPSALYEQLLALSSDEESEVRRLASRAGAAVGGAWSVDIIDTERGWFVTDMAVAGQSFHWPGCPHAPAENPDA